MTKAYFYLGTIFHKRFWPKVHQLSYQVFTLFVDLDHLQEVTENNCFFSLNRFNLLSFWEKDFGPRNNKLIIPLKEKMKTLLDDNGVKKKTISKIYVLTYPRVLGFAFNPLTVFYCYDHNKNPKALVYEVRNTFGERHNYIFKVPEGGKIEEIHQGEKCFHVSPFFDCKGTYVFKVNSPARQSKVSIEYSFENKKRLLAVFTGKRHSISDKQILILTFKYPFMTFKVVGGILFEAFLLWMKGLPIFSHPEKHSLKSTKVFSQKKTTRHQKEFL